MRRRLVNLAAAVSLVMCAVTLIFWMNSYSRPERRSYKENWILTSISGHLVLSQDFTLDGHLVIDDGGAHFTTNWHSAPVDQSFLGVRWYESGLSEMWDFGRGPQGYRLLSAPYWLLLTLFAIAPLLAFRQHMRRRQIATPGLCVRCGYDLRASKERCPECGTAFPAAAVEMK